METACALLRIDTILFPRSLPVASKVDECDFALDLSA